MKSWTRPDGRCFVFGEPDDELPQSSGLYATADEDDAERLERLEALGFVPHRRELVLELATDRRRWRPGPNASPGNCISSCRSGRRASALRLLDDLLRQDVPGTDGWRWDENAFREETYGSPHFDPATYLVAVDRTANYLGLTRVWMRPEQPRLGFVGVRREMRRRVLDARC